MNNVKKIKPKNLFLTENRAREAHHHTKRAGEDLAAVRKALLKAHRSHSDAAESHLIAGGSETDPAKKAAHTENYHFHRKTAISIHKAIKSLGVPSVDFGTPDRKEHQP